MLIAVHVGSNLADRDMADSDIVAYEKGVRYRANRVLKLGIAVFGKSGPASGVPDAPLKTAAVSFSSFWRSGSVFIQGSKHHGFHGGL